MNKLIAIMAVMLLASVATGLACHEQVHVEDINGVNMEGVDVVLSSDCAWGPQTDNTNASGWTTNWAVQNHCTYTASVTTPGLTCEYKVIPSHYNGPHYNEANQGEHYLVCTEDSVPEFSLVAASLAMAGAGAGYLLLRRKK